MASYNHSLAVMAIGRILHCSATRSIRIHNISRVQPAKTTPFKMPPPPLSLPACQVRCYAVGHSNKQFAKAARAKKEAEAKTKKKRSKEFKTPNLSVMQQFTLCDAMRILRAVEVGKPPSLARYDLAVRLKTSRSAKPVRDRIILPYPARIAEQIAVVCPEDGGHVEEALAAGAVAAGQESLFQKIREKKVKFGKLIAHTDSMTALQRSKLGPTLRSLMPSLRTKTVTSNIPKLLKEMSAAEQYNERFGVVRVCIGQMSFSPQMLQDNIKAFISQLKENMEALELEGTKSQNLKSLHEVVLSSTMGPGISLNGLFESTDPNVTPTDLSGPM